MLVYGLMKKLYDRADPSSRWTVRLVVGGILAILPTLSTGIVLAILGVIPKGAPSNPFTVESTGPIMICPFMLWLTFVPLSNSLGRYIDFRSPLEQRRT